MVRSLIHEMSYNRTDRLLVDHTFDSLLSPIGQHRKAYIQPSKGKRSKAQKRKRAHDDENEPQADRHAPPPPAVADSVDIGLATITRTLQELSAEATDRKPTSEDKAESKSVEPYSIVFILRSGVPTAFFNHLPQMVAVSCESLQLAEPTRLVGFSKSCETRLSSCLGIPRVTSVALRGDGTPQARAVVDFVRKTVPVIEVPWLKIAEKRQFQETTINTIQAPVGKKRQKKT